MNVPFRSSRTIAALILREMATTYGRSPGGYLWAILEPVAGTALLTFIFSLVFATPPLGTSFPLFYATGLLPFMLYMDISLKVSQSIQFSKPLLFYPGVTFVDSILARFILNFLTQTLVLFIVFSGIIYAFDIRVILNFSSIFQSLIMAGSLAFGVGVMNCLLNSLFPVWIRIWAILNRPMFIISGMFFLFESIPQPYNSILWFNPLIHVVSEMRKGFYSTYDAQFVSFFFVISVSLVTSLFGIILLRRYNREILNL